MSNTTASIVIRPFSANRHALSLRAEAVSQRGSVRGGLHDSGMPQNFIESRGEQGFLLPPDVRDWVPADHLAWFVIDAVKEMELGAFYGAYRADGHGRAAYEPSMMARAQWVVATVCS